jgi:hypothetical protein
VRYGCIGVVNGVTTRRVAEVHKQLKRGKAVKTTYMLPA